ncbi:MAG: class I SAM-dependent methyltransferase [Chitinophagaceae bacterium]|nr:class I SAM-dependent methyltransferase [Chitinophagaceae bacterium]
MLKYLYRLLHPKFQKLFLEYPVDFKPRTSPHPELYQLINQHRVMYEKQLQKMLSYSDRFFEIKKASDIKDDKQPGWNNGFLPGLDIIALYTLISELKPKRYVEIGSGNSTKVAYKAKHDQQLDTKIISIDPFPRASIDQLADVVIRKPFEQTDFSDILSLQAGDILFVDNSHRILPNSDAMVFFLEVLPRLQQGVVVHIHDIYIPYDYPQFMCDRFYSEQYGLAMYLLANAAKYQPILPNYFISEDAPLAAILAPIWNHPSLQSVEKHGGSFWLKIAE